MANNKVPLTREVLLVVLSDLAARLLVMFGRTVTLAVHGGCVMVLHPYLQGTRRSTQDVDYIHRTFASEWAHLPDATQRLKLCIAATAQSYNLGPDWMNSDPDVALPVQVEYVCDLVTRRRLLTESVIRAANRSMYGRPCETVGYHTKAPGMKETMTVFAAPGLRLIAVPWLWAIALKLVRYQKNDPADIAAILRMAKVRLPHLQVTPQLLQSYLLRYCQPMYQPYMHMPSHMQAWAARIEDALGRAARPQIYW
ncbi:hypothetical protein PUNSTDRAFT_136375 [Punctularia strigosozonata HHB-11173 SS5]|uniref:uncharacterized protein n=1 Tax=Punctularia strigosozonata (strain HHB-11173) TaxID=741275 RepID=UPI0004416D9E|nr:uncharacterized protein PUNSTDRAFT_136375 [Punctularia strigosozonata HHB-11173 SS5]EIN06519.1 hypothetical protein PUNSTDRAFT_136375 [Punctularia strigosozonata HHB-11173 SS5]